MEDPEGTDFPWKPPTLWEALGDEVLNSDGESVDVADLRGPGKVLGLYFLRLVVPAVPLVHAEAPRDLQGGQGGGEAV
eukprot:2737551-Prymnesium_polylepis.1